MPLKLNVGLSRKVADGNYGSRGASVNVELELETDLINSSERLKERIRHLFASVRTSLVEELNGSAANSAVTMNGHVGNSASQPSVRAATQSQVKALHAIARSQGLNLSQLLNDRFRRARPEDLNIKEASSLIDQLKQRKE